jgi:type IV pilus assembly protein PilW
MERNLKQTRRLRVNGFSLIELMVGMFIGLIGIVVIFQAFAAFEGQKRTSTAGADAQETGLMALQTIEREARMAGIGLLYKAQPLCTRLNVYNSTAIPTTLPFLPVVIADGGDAASDTLTVSYSTSPYSMSPAMLMETLDNSWSGSIKVKNDGNGGRIVVKDLLLLGQFDLPTGAARDCTLITVTKVTGNSDKTQPITVDAATGTTPNINPGSSTKLSYAQEVTAVMKVGDLDDAVSTTDRTLIIDRFLRNADGTFTVDNLVDGSNAATVIANNVVAVQAQYGVATTPNGPITAWVNANNKNADKIDWANPTSEQAPLIKAVRIAVVTRSAALEKPEDTNKDGVVDALDAPTQACADSSNAKLFDGPCIWSTRDDNIGFKLDLSGTSNWNWFRYRSYETMIPLRNVIWGNV